MRDNGAYFKSVLGIHLFYLLLFLLLADNYFGWNPTSPVQYVEILSWISPNFFPVVTRAVDVVGILLILICSVYPWSRVLRCVAFLTLLFCIGIASSYGKILHGYYGFLFASLVLVFLPTLKKPYREALTSEAQVVQTVHIFLYAQFSSIICYSMAGIWKIRHIPSTWARSGWSGLFQGLGNTIAYEHVFYSYPVSSVTQFFLDHDILTGFMFFGLIGLQTLAPALVLYEKTHIVFGVFIVIFHLLSEIIVKIPFRPQLYLMALFFILLPLSSRIRKKRESQMF